MLLFTTGLTMKENEKLLIRQSVCITEELEQTLSKAASKLDMAKQDVIRLTMRIGLAHLEAVKYDLAKAVLNESGRLKR